jgi:hypothetical protein
MMGTKRKKSPKIEMKEGLLLLWERARSKTITAKDYDLVVNLLETIEFIAANMNQEEARLKQLLKERLISSEKSSKVFLETKTKQSKAETENPASCSPANDTPQKKECSPQKNVEGMKELC